MQELESGMINMDALCDEDISASVINSGLQGVMIFTLSTFIPVLCVIEITLVCFIHQAITNQ